MAKPDTYNCYQEVPYDECPTYFAHTSFDGEKKTVTVTDGDNEVLKFETGGADSIKINDVEYYNKTKVDSLLSALETKLTAAIATAKNDAISEAGTKDTALESSIKSWANGAFQAKGG